METVVDLRLAVLIDADNVPYANVRGMLEEIAKYGTPTFKRIYADWTKPTVAGWKTVLLENAITPIQQYSYTTGKNATDSAMIIDAMDILYTGRVDGFCIVSSDSDFTRLATRLREAGMKVFGIGEKKTPTPFISACNKFIYLEILKKNEAVPVLEPVMMKNRSRKKAAAKPVEILVKPVKEPEPIAVVETEAIGKVNKEVIKMIADSINDLADESGWAFLGELGNLLPKKQADFDPRNYGFKKLVPLLKNIEQFEIDERETGKGNFKLVYVRVK
ncbi:NYN domain-containing protein [Larkinella rosea]|uniref:NYN domain-containing protein n=1 Tax=Larkinella rosea TaxID=2025312 RepID=A0A3P1BGW6_9BACT|nr:NYN domain-containing protein [Larkinella rosea]RRA99803.1 NYN domain-containing protein [Larkinella rosea]